MTALALLSLLVLSSLSWTGTDATYTLPDNTEPDSYVIHLHPNLLENTFNGTVIIDFTVKETTSVLVLNQKDLDINKIELKGNTMRHWSSDNDLEILIIYYQNELIKENIYRIQIEFEGLLNDMKRGFYRGRYVVGNETKLIGTTHFEPNCARLAFPCWDEPMYKASFEISITHLKNYTTVLSNMPVFNKTDHGTTVTTYFERSLPMSTYLVAFIISDYTYKSHPDNQFKIYTKPDSLNRTEYAWQFSVEAIKQLDIFTEIPYFKLMPKLDKVSVVDFTAGAMENWGLVTYKEAYIFWEEGVSTSVTKEKIATTISHECAHQWFGNLVTPKWWEYIWLNEGFASYFQYYITDKVEPTWRLMDLFVVESIQWGAFVIDGKTNARAMNTPVNSPAEVLALFDGIVYQKAGSVIRMLSHILTQEVFRTGLKNYLSKYSFGVVDSYDLVQYFQAAAGKDMLWDGVTLAEIVRNWFTKPGYPLVTVNKSSPGNYLLTQERFMYYGTDRELKWWIPISYVTNNNMNFTNTSVTHWMRPNVRILTIMEDKSDWILLNKQQTGYYRVNYDDEIWQSLSKYLKSNMHHIHLVNRAQLIDDALTLASKNLTKYETALSLTLYLHHEIDYIPWMTTFKHLEFLHNLIRHSNQYHIFKLYIRFIMHGLTKNVTYEASSKDDHPTKILKGNAIKWACLADVKECVDYAHKEFNAWLKDSKHHLDADLKDTILCTGLRTASEEVWNVVFRKLLESKLDIEEKTSPLQVMGCSNNSTILEDFLMYSAKLDSKIRFALAVNAVVANANVSGVEIVLNVLDTKFPGTVDLNDLDDQISNSISTVASAIVDNENFLRLTRFVVDARSTAELVQKTVNLWTRNIKWIAAYKSRVDNWLVNNEKLFNSRNSSDTLTFTSFLLIFSIFMTRYY